MKAGVRDLSSLKLNFKEGEKIKVTPVGEVVGLDGREFFIEAKEVLASIEKNKLDIPLDENHSFHEAIGWFAKESFEVRGDGIYALLELNKTGLELVEGKKYRYLSPVYNMKNGKVIGLDSVGLVNRPNLLNNALNAQNNQEEKEVLEMELDELQKELLALKEEIKSLKEALASLKESKKEDEASQNEPNNQSLEQSLNERVKQLEEAIKVFGKSSLNEQKNSQDLSEEEMRVARMLGLSNEEYQGGK